MLSGNFAHFKRTKKVEHSKKVSDFGTIRNHLVLYDLIKVCENCKT